MNPRLLSVGLLSAFVVATLPASELTERVRAEAQQCADALLTGDYAALIARTHPRIVDEMGGPERAVAEVADGVKNMKADGITMERVEIGTPSEPVAKGAIVGVIVPQNVFLNTPKGHFRQAGHMLAVSEDGGTHWKFMDTSSLTDESLREYFPALAGLIKLPPKAKLEQVGG